MYNLLLIYLVLAMGSTSWAGNPSSTYYFTAEVPEQWRKVDTDRFLLITKDGVRKQYMLVQERPLVKPFKYTQKILTMGMRPQTAARIIIDEIAADKNISNFRVITNAPATIAGQAGFKIAFTYKDQKGSAFQTIYCGFIKGQTFYNLRYTAARGYYFEKDTATFERFLDGFKLIKAEAT
ncbi:MAG: hypothetical protein JSW39_03855 [Desulfobacterales bacterium]|nr:MAG: hypothetical protein JSW39_03855 [Desulfobacterales bacterium]